MLPRPRIAPKIRGLKLTPEEWARVDKFTGLLAHAEKAQQAFSSGTIPSLHRAIPALEALHSAWSKRALLPEYNHYAPALNKAAEKIDEYYQKTSRSTVQVMAMVLDPSQKGRHFKKHWGDKLASEARETAATIFAERWKKLNAESVAVKPTTRKSSKFSALLRESTPDSDDDVAMPNACRDPLRPWLEEFEEYYDSRPETLLPGMSIVSWWGVRAVQLLQLQQTNLFTSDLPQSPSNLAVIGPRPTCNSCVIGFERARILCRWDHDQ
ncbi:hypothetical protein B0H19DRAFT_157702 [Mycena capillaripes]|nr:hypothetical protein B0H19DRAFT_157702 [Mycena capillaripes]